MSVKIYTTPMDVFGKQAKEFLQHHHIEFTEINVLENKKAAEEMIQKSGQTGVPVIEANGKIIVGFKKEALKQALELKN